MNFLLESEEQEIGDYRKFSASDPALLRTRFRFRNNWNAFDDPEILDPEDSPQIGRSNMRISTG
jgi:hypothetical protein